MSTSILDNIDQAAATLPANTEQSSAAAPTLTIETAAVAALLLQQITEQLANQPKPARTRAEINRENARLSTGPKTESGKSRSRLSAFQHGLCTHPMLLPPDQQQGLAALSERLYNDLMPHGEMERLLVQSIADSQFQIDRARAIENNILNFQADDYVNEADPPSHQACDYAVGIASTFEHDMKFLDLISRYQARHHRQFIQAQAELRHTQIERRKQQSLDAQSRFPLQKADFIRYIQSGLAGRETPQNQGKSEHSGFVPQTEIHPPSTSPEATEIPYGDAESRAEYVKKTMQNWTERRKNKAA